MGLDQHRAQITADWLDTETGEVKRARVAPADRVGVRRFLERFGGEELEVALEATTGWRFVVEELGSAGSRGHPAERADTRARRGTQKPARRASSRCGRSRRRAAGRRSARRATAPTRAIGASS